MDKKTQVIIIFTDKFEDQYREVDVSSVRNLGGADFRYLFQSINQSRIDTPRIINDLYESYHKQKIPNQFHDTNQGAVKHVRMDFRNRLNVIN